MRLNLTTGALTGPQPDHGLTSDRTIALQDAPIPAGALRIADLGLSIVARECITTVETA